MASKTGAPYLLLASVAIAATGCSAKYATGPNGLPVGSPDVTYYGPGAGLGGEQISGPPSAPAAVKPPANLTAPDPGQ